MSGMVNENFKFCVFICLNALFDFIYNHSLFQHVKKKIERDTIIYHTHWSEDTDLKVITKLLRLLFVLGLFIFIFSFTPPMFIGSHFLKLFPFTFDGYQFDLGVIQLVLAVHLIGPKILLFVFLVKLLCDIHIIFFRNSKTKYKMFALGGKVKIFFYVCGGLYCAVEGLEKVTIVLEKWQTLYNSKDLAQNYFRQTTQKWFQGIVRVSEGQEMAYTIMQNRNLKLNTKDIINPYTRVLDVDKLNYQLSLPCNVSEVQKLKPMDFKLLQCITLAKEEDVFRHNLSIVFGVARKEASIDSLICFFSKMEIENFMTSGKECASNLELHQNLKKLIQAISTTEEGRVVLERFISGKSPALFSILQETRSLDADLKQITMERLFQETVIIEDTSSLWLEEHKKSHPIKTFWGLTNEAKLLKEYEAIIRKTIIAFLPKRPA